jgi:MULE transposase domain
MPLLNICGITGSNKVIQIGLVFLSAEKEEDYNWALDQLREIMINNSIQEPITVVTDRELALIKALESRLPTSYHILCRWHVNMNILAKTKQFFPAPTRQNGSYSHHPSFQAFLSDWNTLLNSPTEQEYTRKLQAMRNIHPARAIRYITDTWLIWKENLISYWINQAMHFGVTITSPIEGCHAAIKAALQRGHLDLKGVYDKLLDFWDNQQSC